MSYRLKERRFFQWSYDLRNKLYAPILKFLASFGITANHITYFRAFLIVWILYEMFVLADLMTAAVIYFLLFMILDTFDGALARFRKSENDKGKFNDIFIDQLGYVFFVMGLAFIGVANTFILFYHVIVTGAVYLLATLYKNENEKSDWVIRPEPNLTYFKWITNSFIVILLVFGVNMLDFIFIIVNVRMTITGIYYFILLQKQKYLKKS